MSDLTAKEQDCVRAALRFLRMRLGADPLAKVLRAHRASLRRAINGRGVTASLAIRTARLAGVGIDDLLIGKSPPPGTCVHCGHRAD